jgi:hypothetical protein
MMRIWRTDMLLLNVSVELHDHLGCGASLVGTEIHYSCWLGDVSGQ